MEHEAEVLKDMPQERIDILNGMPVVKEKFIADKIRNKDEMIAPCFFSYFADDYMLCKSFFSCFERGEEVFNNFYRIYGEKQTEREDFSEEELHELLLKHLKGVNNVLALGDMNTYDFSNVKMDKTTYEELEDEYDLEEIEENVIDGSFSRAVYRSILPRQSENPIVAFEEALYN